MTRRGSTRRRGRPLAVAPLLAVLLVGCCPYHVPDLPPDEHEPNDDVSQATALTLGAAIEATMNGSDGPDVFRFEAAEGQRLRVEVELVDGGWLHFEAQLGGPGTSTATDLYLPGDGTPYGFDHVATETGTYYLTLVGISDVPADALCLRAVLRYRLRVSLVEPEDATTAAVAPPPAWTRPDRAPALEPLITRGPRPPRCAPSA